MELSNVLQFFDTLNGMNFYRTDEHVLQFETNIKDEIKFRL